MRLPRDLSGHELIKLLKRYGYELTRQVGSHIRLKSSFRGRPQYVTIQITIACVLERSAQSSLMLRSISESSVLNSHVNCLENDRKTVIDRLAPIIVFAAFIGFVCFEGFHAVRGTIHWRGIARAALELLIVSPVFILLVFLSEKITDYFRLNDVDARVLKKWFFVGIGLLVWAPWTHYRATQSANELRRSQN